MYCTAYAYYNGQMYMCLIASSIKIITKHIVAVYHYSEQNVQMLVNTST